MVIIDFIVGFISLMVIYGHGGQIINVGMSFGFQGADSQPSVLLRAADSAIFMLYRFYLLSVAVRAYEAFPLEMQNNGLGGFFGA
jgi:hypothetical protein